MLLRKAGALLAFTAIGACAGPPATYTASAPPPAPAATSAPRVPVTGVVRGLDGIIGEGATSITAKLGETRIDLREGDARKLQFAGSSCVLDIYLYPDAGSREPVATHVSARARAGGASVDEAACLSEITGR